MNFLIRLGMLSIFIRLFSFCVVAFKTAQKRSIGFFSQTGFFSQQFLKKVNLEKSQRIASRL